MVTTFDLFKHYNLLLLCPINLKFELDIYLSWMKNFTIDINSKYYHKVSYSIYISNKHVTIWFPSSKFTKVFYFQILFF